MDWTSGYVSDIEHTSSFYCEQGPGCGLTAQLLCAARSI
jgi:hypothetical protein